MTNKINTVLYTGITSNLKKRIWEHKEKVIDGFTKNYNMIVTQKVNKPVLDLIGE